MARNNFFANISLNQTESQNTVNKEEQANIDSHLSTVTSSNDIKGSSPKNKRVAYTIKIDPLIRKAIKDWAIEHDVTISSVIEALARTHLEHLKDDEIQM